MSYDGVLYGLPAEEELAGKMVQVRERRGVLTIWSSGKQILCIEKRPRSQEAVPHPEQWKGVASASEIRRAPTPLGHHQPLPQVSSRALSDYDLYAGLTSGEATVLV
ncbi:MAG TPA: hypothetical protein VFV38_07040 [Ktedonobacteraceae bacterium]|nr:hypothetical protein [Ktedonobacteraceae bacterium]